MAGTTSEVLVTTSSPVLTKWKLTQDEENGNTIEASSPVQNRNASPRPVLNKTESFEVVDCKTYSLTVIFYFCLIFRMYNVFEIYFNP